MADKPDIYPDGVELRDWEDFSTMRRSLFDSTREAVATQFPISYGGVRLEVHDLDYDKDDDYTLADQKDALMTGKYLTRRLRGTYRLFDDKSGDLLDEQPATIMKVPYMTERGTFIHGGNEYTTIHQARLLPGAYTRRKESGELETHFNAKRGTGHSFRVRLEPETGLFKLDIGQASLRLYSLLKDIGVSDEDLEKRWGKDLLENNKKAYDRRVFEKAYQRLVRRPDPSAPVESKIQAIRDALAATKLKREVIESTLPNLIHQKVASAWREALHKTASTMPAGYMDAGLGGDAGLDLGGGEAESGGLTKQDLIAIAMLLNNEFQAGIPLDQTLAGLAADIRDAIDENMPGLMPEVAAGIPAAKAAAEARIKEAAAVRTKEELDRAANRAATSPTNRKKLPTKPQKHTGNYSKGHVRLHGFNIAIENPRGSIRSGSDREGKKWSIRMKHHYGYIKRTEGNDGDHLDVFIGPDLDTDSLWVVNQINPRTGLFDEHKILMGFATEDDARKGYLSNYQKDWRGLGSIYRFDVNKFRELLPELDFSRVIKPKND